MFDNPTDNHTDIEVPLYYKLRFTKLTKTLYCHLNFRKCTQTVDYIAVLRVATLIFGENKMACMAAISAKYMASSRLFMHRRL